MLTYNSIQARRGRAVIMSNDSKGCYDRIAHTVVNLTLQWLGIPKPALQSMLATIQEMEHHIWTAFGDSKRLCGNDQGHPPPRGILQGSGAGPVGWSSITAVVIKAMQEQGFGYSAWTLIQQRAIAMVGFAFVDDTDCEMWLPVTCLVASSGVLLLATVVACAMDSKTLQQVGYM
jgi:hypothetical protein